MTRPAAMVAYKVSSLLTYTPLLSGWPSLYGYMRPRNDQEWDTLPHILLTCNNDVWNPSWLDDEFLVANLLLDASTPDTGNQDPRVNNLGEYTGNLNEDIDLILHECRTEHTPRVATDGALHVLECGIDQHTVSKAAPSIEALRPNFGWLPL